MLTGQLEDLPILDVLQIVAFSQKSGYLSVEGPQGRGAVLFKGGLVHCCYSWSTLERLKRIAGRPDVEPAELGAHIELSLRELAQLHSGTFTCELTDDAMPEKLDGIDVPAFDDYQGLNAQHLLLDLAKGMDEERRQTMTLIEASAKEGEPQQSPSQLETEPGSVSTNPVAADFGTIAASPGVAKELAAPQEVEPLSSRTIEIPALQARQLLRSFVVVIVDDEPLITTVLSQEIGAQGYLVCTANSPQEAAAIVRQKRSEGEPVVLVTDLKMPTTAGTSFLGGLELVEILERGEHRVPVLLMAEQLDAENRMRAVELGIRRVAFKPTLTKPDPELYREDLRVFAGEVLRQLEQMPSSSARTVVKNEGRAESKEAAALLDYLASMTTRIMNSRQRAEISRIVLHVAAKYMDRAILFLVKRREAMGLLGFGVATDDDKSAELVKALRVNILEASPFAKVVQTRKVLGPVADVESLDATLYRWIGRNRCREFVLMPMLNNGEVLTILYGDNDASGRRLERPRGLELVMAQAGMAYENSLLQERLRGLGPEEVIA